MINFENIFEGLPQPMAICDCRGAIVAINQKARIHLGIDSLRSLKLDLTKRETFAEMKVSTSNGEHEYFLADVEIAGAARSTVSVSLGAIDDGHYRVLFQDNDVELMSAGLKLFQALSGFGEHVELLQTAEEVVSLYGSCLLEVFPEYAFQLAVQTVAQKPLFVYETAASGASWRQRNPLDLGASRAAGAVPRDELGWKKSGSGWRVCFEQGEHIQGCMQIETRQADGFTPVEIETFETFVQQLGFALVRFRKQAARSEFGLVTPILNQLQAIVVICDSRRRIRVSNQAFQRLVGIDAEDTTDVLEFFHREDQGDMRTAAAAAMAGNPPQPFMARIKSDNEHASASLELTVRVSPLAPADVEQVGPSRGFVLVAQVGDATLTDLQERFARAEQLMNLGQLATGVAHELKNPLTSILNYADYLLDKYRGQFFEKRDGERLQRIIDGVERMDRFVRDLLSLANSNEVIVESVCVHPTIQEAVSLCEVAVAERRVTVKLRLEAETAWIQGVQGQLLQIFINLITNATKAMPPEGGTLEIATFNKDSTLICQVSDDACGMSEEVMAQIFEPFFTTRLGGDGSGLGLALCRRIVENHRGTINVTSIEGEGTTFTIRLPLSCEGSETVKEQQ